MIALRWNSFGVPLTPDEGEYAYSAQLLRHGLPPYEFSFLQKPPLVVYFYLLADILAPHAEWAPRALCAAFVALATVLVGLIARREFGPGHTLAAMWLLTPMVLLPGLEEFTANTEAFMLLPLLATIALYVYGRTSEKSAYWLAAGVCAASTLCCKYTALPILGTTFLVWSVEYWRKTGTIGKLLVRWSMATAGGCIGLAAALGYFLAKDGGRHFWECTVQFNSYYAGSGIFTLRTFAWRFEKFLMGWPVLFLLPWVLAVMSLLPWVLAVKRAPRVWLWVLLLVISLVSTDASLFGHYYILVMPFWALLTAASIRKALELLAARFPRFNNLPPASVVVTSLVVLTLCLPDLPWLFKSPGRFAETKFKQWFMFPDSRMAARHIAELSPPGSRVLMVGEEPEVLYEAQRLNSTRFVVSFPLVYPTPLIKKYQEEAIHDIQAHPPAVIILVRAGMSWQHAENCRDYLNFLDQLLDEQYERIGGCIPGEYGSHWQEPLAPEDLDRVTFALFRRKAG